MSQVHTDNLKEIERLDNDIQELVIKYSQLQLDMRDKNFTGDLRGLIKKGPINGDGFPTVIVDSPHGVPVEFGMPAGIHVNFDELRKWVEGKLGVDPSESKNVTFKIWKKILDKGIPQTRFFKKGIKMTIAQVGILNMRTTPDIWVRRINKFNKEVKAYTKYIKKINKVRQKLRR